MIGTDLSELGEAVTVAAARSLVRKRLVAENDELRLIAHFAEIHNADSIGSPSDDHVWDRLPIRGERAVALGGAGTPKIAEFAPKPFGLEARMSPSRPSRNSRRCSTCSIDCRGCGGRSAPIGWRAGWPA